MENADGSGPKQLTNTGDANWAHISADGKKVVYNLNQWHILVINTDGSGALDLTPTLPANTRYCYDGSLSADSKQVAFACAGGSGAGIYTMMANGTGIKSVVLSAGSRSIDSPAFTPDGKRLFYYDANSTGSGVFGVNIDGTGATLMVPKVRGFVVLNSSMYYSPVCIGNASITKANLDGTNPVVVTDGTFADGLYYSPSYCSN